MNGIRPNKSIEEIVREVADSAAQSGITSFNKTPNGIYIGIPNGKNLEVYHMPQEHINKLTGVSLINNTDKIKDIIMANKGELIATYQIPYNTEKA